MNTDTNLKKNKSNAISLITIKKSHDELDLIVLKSRLESEGINCILRNECTTQIMNHMATFEVELQVSEIDLERVKEILTELERN
jgi:hypothetical protein